MDTHHFANLTEQIHEMTLNDSSSQSRDDGKGNCGRGRTADANNADNDDDDEEDEDAEDMEAYLASGMIDNDDKVWQENLRFRYHFDDIVCPPDMHVYGLVI